MRSLPLAAPTLAIVVLAALSGCVAAAAPEPSSPPAASESASVEPSPSAEPIALPTCDTIYSDAVVASLTAEGRESQGDVSAPGGGGWGTADPGLEAILSGIDERVSCSWILPASESGSTTSIARIDATTRAALDAAFSAAGFFGDGTLYGTEVETELGSYNEAHVLTDEFWIGSVYWGGDADELTNDALAQLLP